jgi:hypothetical protein
LSVNAAKQKMLLVCSSLGMMWGHWLVLGGIHRHGSVVIGSSCYCKLSGLLPVGASFCPSTLLGTVQDMFALNLRACTRYLPSAWVESPELVSQWGDKKCLVHKLELVLLVR